MQKKFRLIILDRDGVINQDSPSYIRCAQDWQPIPGSLEAIAALKHAGYKIVIATNQSGIGRGLFTLADLEAMHEKLRQTLNDMGGSIDGIFFCPHRPDEKCACRKPAIGLLTQINQQFPEISKAQILFIGDAWGDFHAAQNFGCDFFLVLTGKGHKTLSENPRLFAKTSIYPDLAAATQALLGSSGL